MPRPLLTSAIHKSIFATNKFPTNTSFKAHVSIISFSLSRHLLSLLLEHFCHTKLLIHRKFLYFRTLNIFLAYFNILPFYQVQVLYIYQSVISVHLHIHNFWFIPFPQCPCHFSSRGFHHVTSVKKADKVTSSASC